MKCTYVLTVEQALHARLALRARAEEIARQIIKVSGCPALVRELEREAVEVRAAISALTCGELVSEPVFP